ncbi:MAG: hypothetical protein KA163_06520 [Bacteroidia bacterium]|nr:hypothetical protein [Bacteroidia bacterium]
MRKAFLLITTIAFISCAKKHDYKCTCDVTGQWSGRYTTTYHQTEGEADMFCRNYGESIADGYGDSDCFIEKQN